MKKNIFKKISIFALLSVIALGVGIFNAKAVGVNSIANPGFETQADATTPANWSQGGFGGNDRAVTYENVGGNKFGKVKITAYTNGDAKWVFQDVPVEAGALYRFSDRYMSNATTFLFVQYIKADASSTYEQIASVPTSGGVWVTGAQDFTPPAGTVHISIFHTLQSVGELSTDDYSLTQLSTPAENQFSQGIVSITFDDGWLNQYTNAYPKLTALNMSATYYVTSGPVLNNEFGYMTSTQILNLQLSGSEIGGHTMNHCNLTLLPAIASCAFTPASGTTTAQQQIEGSKNALTTLGAVVSTFAYPNGAYTDAIKANITGAGISAARAIDAGFNTRYSDKLALKTQIVDTTVPIATILGWIDTAAANKTWLILTFHQVTDLATLLANGDVGGVTPENFQTIINHIASVRDAATNAILVKTVVSVLPLMSSTAIDPVNLLDTVAPTIVLNGNATVSAVLGSVYIDAGATASDNVDGNLTSSIVVVSSVTTSTAGTYTITYNVTDAAGNHATQVSRTVIVSENAIPVISLVGATTITLAIGDTYVDAGATASDIEDGNITASIVKTGSVNTSTPNTYPITYSVSDSHGGAAIAVTRTVIVQGNNSGGGGGSGGGYVPQVVPIIPIVITPTTPGTVLGSTCNAILLNTISFHNKKNKVEDVKKLQSFLNIHMNAKLPVTGFYGSMTLSAVKNFQSKYKAEILTPVKLSRGNGNVFILTRAKINTLNCVAQ